MTPEPEAVIGVGTIDLMAAIPDSGVVPSRLDVDDVRVDWPRIESRRRAPQRIAWRAVGARRSADGVPSDRARRAADESAGRMAAAAGAQGARNPRPPGPVSGRGYTPPDDWPWRGALPATLIVAGPATAIVARHFVLTHKVREALAAEQAKSEISGKWKSMAPISAAT